MTHRPTGFHIRKPAFDAFDNCQFAVYVGLHCFCRQERPTAPGSVSQFSQLRFQLWVKPDCHRGAVGHDAISLKCVHLNTYTIFGLSERLEWSPKAASVRQSRPSLRRRVHDSRICLVARTERLPCHYQGSKQYIYENKRGTFNTNPDPFFRCRATPTSCDCRTPPPQPLLCMGLNRKNTESPPPRHDSFSSQTAASPARRTGAGWSWPARS